MSLGIACTKYASAAQRSTIDTSRTIFIWIVSVLLGLESFIAMEIPGFIILALGTLLYNEIIVIPYFGFNEWTKDAIAKRAQAEQLISKEEQDLLAPETVKGLERNKINMSNNTSQTVTTD